MHVPPQHNYGAMNGEPLKHKIVITNPQGFHMRPISAFVKLASQFESDVSLVNAKQERFDGKSPLNLLGLGADQGTELLLEVSGPDQKEALDALVKLIPTLMDYDSETAEGSERQ